MPTYHFMCRVCGEQVEISRPLSDSVPNLSHCQTPARRLFGFNHTPSYDGGFNPSTGSYTSNSHDLSEQLKAASDIASESTGIHHNFVLRDAQDKAAFGITNDDVEDVREARGRRILDPNGRPYSSPLNPRQRPTSGWQDFNPGAPRPPQR